MSKNDNFIDFFNVYNVDHLEAYRQLSDTGTWPEGFIADGMDMPMGWLSIIQDKMSAAYVRNAVLGNIYAMPALDQ